ncbi:MAG TPA: WD40 repeat domain-containing protein, partial [Pirellulales bacterium]|nr:WD40 repeat domain-containing protein [Pirellulales bacterium]
ITAPDHVVLRDAATGKVLRTLDEPAKGVKSLAISADGKRLATAADDKKVRLWSLPGGTLQATLTGAQLPLVSIALSPDGRHVVATGRGKRSLVDQTSVAAMWIWNLAEGTAQKVDLGGAVAGPIVFVDSETVLTAVGRELWEITFQSGRVRHRSIASMSDEILAVALSPDRTLLACGGKDRTVDLLERSTGKLVHRMPGFMTGFSAVAASKDGKRFATATIENRFVNIPASKSEPANSGWKQILDDEATASRIAASEVKVWSAENGRLITSLQLPAMQVDAIDFLPDSRQLAVAGWSREAGATISLWETDRGKPVRELARQTSVITTFDISPDGTAIAAGDAQGKLTVWNVAQSNTVSSHGFDNPIEAVAYSGDGNLLAVALDAGHIRLLDLRSGETRREMKSQSPLHALAFSPDGALLAAGLRSQGLELWDLRSKGDGRILKAAGDYLDKMPGYVAFSADSRLVVCGGHGKDIAVFDTSTGDLKGELRGHEHPATAAAFLADGRLVSAGSEGAIKMWDVARMQLLATWCMVPADPARQWADTWVAFRPSGEFICSNNTQRLVGWIVGGEIVAGNADNVHKRRVDRLFGGDAAAGAH